MTKDHDDFDQEDEINAEDLKFFNKRAKLLASFAKTDLEASLKKSKEPKKKPQSAGEAFDAAEDAQITALKKLQSTLENNRRCTKAEEENPGSDADEGDYENRFLKAKAKTAQQGSGTIQKTASLPIRTAAGEWKASKATATVVVSSNQAPEDLTEEIAVESESDKETCNASPVQSFEDLKEKIALLAMEITENIEENLSKMKELLRYTQPGILTSDPQEQGELVRIALITALAVFKDILPSYPIRQLSESERNARVSKEVKKLRSFEECILNSYRAFVTRLEEILKTNKKGDAALVPIAVACLGELASFASHFNYNERVLSAICGQVFKDGPTGLVAQKSLGKMFAEDELGRLTSKAMRLLSDSFNARAYCPPVESAEEVIQVLSNIRLKVLGFSRTDALPSKRHTVAEEAARLDAYKRKAAYLSKAQRKQLRVDLEDSVKSAEAEAEVSREERAKWSTDALKFLFRILFGILKRTEELLQPHNVGKDSECKHVCLLMLPEVMRSLARCAQFLSVEFFNDLLMTLKRIITAVESEQSFETCLHTIKTVVEINTLQEMAPSVKGIQAIDLKFYFDLLYRQLLKLPSVAVQWNADLENLLEAVMTRLFFSKKHIPPARVAAFIHRCVCIIDKLEGRQFGSLIIYLTRLVLRLLDRHEKARGVLDEETLGVAAYLPHCNDPDLCNPFCKQFELMAMLRSLKETRKISIPNELISMAKKLLASIDN